MVQVNPAGALVFGLRAAASQKYATVEHVAAFFIKRQSFELKFFHVDKDSKNAYTMKLY